MARNRTHRRQGPAPVKAILVGHGSARDANLQPTEHYLIAKIVDGPKAFIGRDVHIKLSDKTTDIDRMSYRGALDDMLVEAKEAEQR